MKKKLLLTSILSIVMCFSLICGATFALFTSESTVNVAVTSGTVKVVAVPTIVDDETSLYAGEATIGEDGNISITNMLPMDKVTVNIAVDNQSNVAIKYYTHVQFKEQNVLTEDLVVTVDDKILSGAMYSEWKDLSAEVDGTTIKIVIELPEDATASNGGYTCDMAITVNAIQGNADVQPFVTDVSDFKSSIANGGATLANDLTLSYTIIEKDVVIDLNDKTLEMTNIITLAHETNLTMKGGNYKISNNTANGQINAGNNSELIFEGVNFSYNRLSRTNGTSTNRLGNVVSVYVSDADAKTVVKFKDCTFNNAQVSFSGNTTGEVEAIFENCTFTALTNSAPIYINSNIKGTINVTDCTFDIQATAADANAIWVNSSTSTAVTVVATNNTFNASKATPTDSSVTGINQIKVSGSITSISFIGNKGTTSTVTETGTIKTGIAQ